MRIGIEAQRIFRKKKHGMDIYALQLIKHLQKVDHENEYFIFVKPGEDVCIESSANFTVVEVKGLSYADWEQVSLPIAAARYKLDCLHCTSNTAPILSSVPLILTLHDIIYLNKTFSGGSLYQRLGHYYRKWVVPTVFRKAKKVLTVSAFEKETIEAHFGKTRKLSVCYNGVDKKFSHELNPKYLKTIRRQLDLPDHYFFFLGNTAPKKNMKGMLEAYLEYCGSVKNPHALVVAESTKEEVNKILKPMGSDISELPIRLTGYLSHDWLPAVYRLSDGFIYPSLRESFGIPIIEAMACGAPVITSNTSSMPEVGGGAAIYTDPTAPSEIAEAMTRLSTKDQLGNDLIAAGIIRASGFRWEDAAYELKKIYQSLAQDEISLASELKEVVA